MAVKPFTPSWIERLVRRCLAKDPEDRYQSMRDVVLDLRTPPQESATTTSKPNHWKWATAACATLAIAAGIFALRKTGEPLIPTRLDVNPPSGSRFNLAGSAISPDGNTLAFGSTNAKGESLLYLRSMDSLEARALPGTEAASRAFWSPNSKSIGFVSDRKLKRIDVAGGIPIPLCDVLFARGGTRSKSTRLNSSHGGISRMPSSA